MGEPSVTLQVEDELTVDVQVEDEFTAEELSNAIGNDIILEGDGRPFGYLAGLAFEGMDGDDDVVDVLVEFLVHETEFDFRDGEVEQIETILRDAHE